MDLTAHEPKRARVKMEPGHKWAGGPNGPGPRFYPDPQMEPGPKLKNAVPGPNGAGPNRDPGPAGILLDLDFLFDGSATLFCRTHLTTHG